MKIICEADIYVSAAISDSLNRLQINRIKAIVWESKLYIECFVYRIYCYSV